MIVTNWGSFTHNILHGQTGYFVQDGPEAVWAAEHIDSIESWRCRKWNMNYTIDKAIPKFERYFERIAHIQRNGGDSFKPYPVQDLSHREMIYPDDLRYDMELNCVIDKKGGKEYGTRTV